MIIMIIIIIDVTFLSIENQHFLGSNSGSALVPSISQGLSKTFLLVAPQGVHHSIDEEAESQRRLSPLPKEPSPVGGVRDLGSGDGVGESTEKPAKDPSPWSQQTTGWGCPALPPSPFLLALAMI